MANKKPSGLGRGLGALLGDALASAGQMLPSASARVKKQSLPAISWSAVPSQAVKKLVPSVLASTRTVPSATPKGRPESR